MSYSIDVELSSDRPPLPSPRTFSQPLRDLEFPSSELYPFPVRVGINIALASC
jgi:hypothetical protein